MTNTALLYLNGFAVLVLLLTLRNYRQKFKYICCEEKVFIFFILCNIATLVFEAALENLWGHGGRGVRVLLFTLQTADFLLSAAIPLLWLYYVLFRLYHISNVSRRTRLWIALPAVLYALLLFAALPGGAAFSINMANQYSRGVAFWESFALGYAYMAAAIMLLFVKRKTLNRGELFPYLLVPMIPLGFGVANAVFDLPTSLIWAATTLVILEIQMLILNNRTNIDHLTSLNNRMALDHYVKRAIHESHVSGEPFGLMMIDIDDFKQINDQYGHPEGDRALKTAADILRECFAGSHFIARYGGDEFTVVLKNCTREQMNGYLEQLAQAQQKRGAANHRPYSIRLSVGASVFARDEITDAYTMLMQVDQMMYEQKRQKKNRAPR